MRSGHTQCAQTWLGLPSIVTHSVRLSQSQPRRECPLAAAVRCPASVHCLPGNNLRQQNHSGSSCTYDKPESQPCREMKKLETHTPPAHLSASQDEFQKSSLTHRQAHRTHPPSLPPSLVPPPSSVINGPCPPGGRQHDRWVDEWTERVNVFTPVRQTDRQTRIDRYAPQASGARSCVIGGTHGEGRGREVQTRVSSGEGTPATSAHTGYAMLSARCLWSVS